MDIPIHSGFDTGMAEQLLQYLGRDAAFYCTRCISVAKGMHTESADAGCVTKLIQMCVIGTVFVRLARPISIFEKYF